MSLIKANPYTVPYRTAATDAPETVGNVPDSVGYVAVSPTTIAIPHDILEQIYQKLKQAERPLVSFQDDMGEMFLEAFTLRERIIKEVLQELEPYV